MTLLTFLNCYRSSAAEEFLHSLNLQLKSKIVPRRTCSRAERSNAFVENILRGMFNFQDIFWSIIAYSIAFLATIAIAIAIAIVLMAIANALVQTEFKKLY